MRGRSLRRALNPQLGLKWLVNRAKNCRSAGDVSKNQEGMVCPARFERATYALEGRCSIQLSYGQITEFKQLFQNQGNQAKSKASRSSGIYDE